MTGTINVRIMPRRGLILDMLQTQPSAAARSPIARPTHSSRDRDTSRLLLGRLVNLRIVHKLSAALFREVLGDGGGQGGLSVIDVLYGEI